MNLQRLRIRLNVYLEKIQVMKINKEDIILVDDTLRNIEGAQLFGMQTNHYNKIDDLFACVKKSL